jgi:hypothetical protein
MFHEGGVVGEPPPGIRYAHPAIFEHAPRHHAGGVAGFGVLPDEVPIIARRGELVVPPERVVREEKTAPEQRPITVMINVAAADVNSFRASQGHPGPWAPLVGNLRTLARLLTLIRPAARRPRACGAGAQAGRELC